METLFRLPFAVLECPNIKLKRPGWVHMPSAMTVYALVVVSYFLITGGIIYDVIVEPPSVGSMTDEHGHQRPVAFLAYRWERRPARTQTRVKELYQLALSSPKGWAWLKSGLWFANVKLKKAIKIQQKLEKIDLNKACRIVCFGNGHVLIWYYFDFFLPICFFSGCRCMAV
uniref:Oligosaccharyltransferase complex subunit n=1 Tax=Chrysolophus pictus TaxID=9089 RepID=A0A8C3PZH7_CHRPC